MSEKNTTSAATDISAEASEAIFGDSQVEDTAAVAEAGDSTEETHTDTESGAESVDTKSSTESIVDDEDEEWLRNKGVDPNDPAAVKKAVKLARDAEREFHKARQSKPSESIEATVAKDENVQALDEANGMDPSSVKLQRDVAELRFFGDHPEITREVKDQVQAEIVAAAKKFPKLAADFDLETLYAIAKSERVNDVEKTAEARGRKAKAEEIERSSGAAIPDGSATAGAAKGSSDSDFLKGFNS